MIKTLLSAKPDELKKLIGEDFQIIEKIDAPYFIIEKHNDEIKVMKRNHSEITDIDCLLNNSYHEIINISNNIAGSFEGNNYRLGMWFFPSAKPKNIEYPKYTGKFMISDYSGDITTKDLDILYINDILPKPIIGNLTLSENTLHKIESYKSGKSSALFFLTNLLKGTKKYPGTPLENMEGVILRFKNAQYQIIINEKETQKEDADTKKIYRDMLLKDFLAWYNKHLPYIEGKTIKEKITYLFSKYIKETDIHTKYSITADNLTPPNYGYIGGLTIDDIPNEEVKQMCMFNPVTAKMYKIIMNACRKPLKRKENDLLTNNDLISFNKMVKEIEEAD